MCRMFHAFWKEHDSKSDYTKMSKYIIYDMCIVYIVTCKVFFHVIMSSRESEMIQLSPHYLVDITCS